MINFKKFIANITKFKYIFYLFFFLFFLYTAYKEKYIFYDFNNLNDFSKKEEDIDSKQKIPVLQPSDWKNLLKNINALMKERRQDQPELKAFISYAWEDTSTNEGKEKNSKLQKFLERLREDLQLAGISVFLDISDMHGEMKTRMKEYLSASDIIFTIHTPRFKQRAKDPTTNLNFEYNIILDKIKKSPYSILPLHYSGNFNEAIPEELYTYLIRDCRDFRNYKNMMIQTERPLGIIPAIYNVKNNDVDYKNVINSWKLKHLNNISSLKNNYFDREELLNKFEFFIQKARQDPERIITICGINGIGKSEMALAYARKNYQKYQFIRWIQGDKRNLEMSIISMAKDLGIEIEGKDINEIAQDIYKKIKDFTWILIFDDIHQYNEIQKLLPKKMNKDQLIIVTSNSQSWSNKFQMIPFTKIESSKFIKRNFTNINNKEAELLGETLGYLPEPISAAIYFIKENNISISQFLEIYKISENNFLDVSNLKKINKSPLDMLTNKINNDLEEIKNKTPAAFIVLKACAYLYPENIPVILFKNSHLFNEDSSFYKNLKELYQFSFITSGEDKNYISINPFLQKIILNKISRRDDKIINIDLLTELKKSIELNYSNKKLMFAERKMIQHHINILDVHMITAMSH